MLDQCDNIFGRSFCALADGAVSPIQSSIKYFRDEYLQHLAEGGCPFDPMPSDPLRRRAGDGVTTAPEKVDASVPDTVKTVSLTIDGIQLSVPENTLVIRAAEQVGVQIPRFCDHPLLAPVGACRQCLVDIPDAGNGRGFPKPQASCTLPVAEGMVVNTQVTSEVADKAQQGIMEFLLINHPLDCPVCDKGGECPLQNQAMSNGRGESRFFESGGLKRTFPKPINISAQVLLDRERCVLCARCTRFSAQIAGDPFIELLERGALQQVGIYEQEPYDSYFSGNAIQICPVGALTSAEYRFRSRPFDLVSTPSIAEHDACGSAIRVDHRRGKVMRRLAGNDPEVNEEWITDKDRFAFHYATAGDRLTYPQVREPCLRTRETASCARRPGPRRSRSRPAGSLPLLPTRAAWACCPAAGSPPRTATPTRSSPGSRSAPTTSTSGPGRCRPRRRRSSPPTSCSPARATAPRRTPTSSVPTPCCWPASSPRTRPARSSCGCARPTRAPAPRSSPSRRSPRAGCARWAARSSRPRPATRPRPWTRSA